MKMDETTEKAYREKLKDVRDAIKATKRLMKSKEKHIRLRAIDLFIQLSEMEIALVEYLKGGSEPVRDERNPLARRASLGR